MANKPITSATAVSTIANTDKIFRQRLETNYSWRIV